ncbi:MAG: hypothetical protein LBF65_01900 [Holosporales bacterium]|jgi:hypothetical protein|nr:hypothetical protein [Holosporales bacterium]
MKINMALIFIINILSLSAFADYSALPVLVPRRLDAISEFVRLALNAPEEKVNIFKSGVGGASGAGIVGVSTVNVDLIVKDNSHLFPEEIAGSTRFSMELQRLGASMINRRYLRFPEIIAGTEIRFYPVLCCGYFDPNDEMIVMQPEDMPKELHDPFSPPKHPQNFQLMALAPGFTLFRLLNEVLNSKDRLSSKLMLEAFNVYFQVGCYLTKTGYLHGDYYLPNVLYWHAEGKRPILSLIDAANQRFSTPDPIAMLSGCIYCGHQETQGLIPMIGDVIRRTWDTALLPFTLNGYLKTIIHDACTYDVKGRCNTIEKLWPVRYAIADTDPRTLKDNIEHVAKSRDKKYVIRDLIRILLRYHSIPVEYVAYIKTKQTDIHWYERDIFEVAAELAATNSLN